MINVKKGQVDFYFIFDKKNIPVFLTMKIKIYLSTTKFYLAHILNVEITVYSINFVPCLFHPSTLANGLSLS